MSKCRGSFGVWADVIPLAGGLGAAVLDGLRTGLTVRVRQSGRVLGNRFRRRKLLLVEG